MPRSLKKGPHVDHHLAQKVDVAKKNNEKRPIKTWSRRSMVSPCYGGLNNCSAQREATYSSFHH